MINFRNIFSTIIFFKFILLLLLGPLWLKDTSSYLGFAEHLLSNPQDLFSVDLDDPNSDITTFRIIGYPLLIMLAKSIFGSYWQYFIIIGQITFSCYASYLFYKLCLNLGLGKKTASIALALQMLTLPIYLDQALLTDSFCSSCIIICCYLLSEFNTRSYVKYSLLIGLAFLGSFLMREFMLYISPVIAFSSYFILKDKNIEFKLIIKSIILMLAPILLTAILYSNWNYYRTGFSFVTIGAKNTALVPLVKLHKHGVPIFNKSQALDKLVEKNILSDEVVFSEVCKITGDLYRDYGYNQYEINKIATSRYYAAWFEYPFEMVKFTFRNIDKNLLTLLFQPIRMIMTNYEVAYGLPASSSGNLMRQYHDSGDIKNLIIYGINTSQRIVSVLMMLVFFISPLFFFKQYKGYYILYFGVLFSYAIIHFMTRYIAPVVPISILFVSNGVVHLARQVTEINKSLAIEKSRSS